MSRSSAYQSVPAGEPRPLSDASALDPFVTSDQYLAPPSAPYNNIAPSISSTPRGSYMQNDTPRDSFAPGNSSPLLTAAEKPVFAEDLTNPPRRRSVLKRPAFWLVLAAIVAVVVVAVVVPVYFTVIKPNQRNASGGSSGGGGGGSTGGGSGTGGNGTTPTPSGAISGGDGSVVTATDGSKFTYKNSFGGFCGSRYVNFEILLNFP
jgi:glucan 1,3-beta-glucosidase